MAKELPYFKFEPNQWENGNIQMLTRHDKGLFLDLCSMYWSRVGNVPLKLAIQKLCDGNATAFDSLILECIFEVIDGNIFIKFLSEQLNEFEDISNQNAKNAKDGWEKRRKIKASSDINATASISQCENDAIREEKRREEKRREEKRREEEIKKNKTPTAEKFSFFKSLIDFGFKENLVNDWLVVRKNKKASNTETAFKNFINQIQKQECDINEVLSVMVTNSWSGFQFEWYNNLKNKNLQNATTKPNNESDKPFAGRQTAETIRKNSEGWQ